MSYQKQNFANGEVLTAPQLNHIEDGIVDLESNSGDLFIKITEETERAKAAEQANADGIAAEASRAEQAEQALDARTAALESCGFVVVDGKICVRYLKR